MKKAMDISQKSSRETYRRERAASFPRSGAANMGKQLGDNVRFFFYAKGFAVIQTRKD
ncbi:MAG: hypothetical protein LIO57_07690 [Oscillospiraceae bacterium]|nr:hypothetical protein [Oscillospiraceae bacterium]